MASSSYVFMAIYLVACVAFLTSMGPCRSDAQSTIQTTSSTTQSTFSTSSTFSTFSSTAGSSNPSSISTFSSSIASPSSITHSKRTSSSTTVKPAGSATTHPPTQLWATQPTTTSKIQCCLSEDCYVAGVSASSDVYCCGNRTARYCCTNESLEYLHPDAPRCNCDKEGCYYSGWQALFGVLALILFTFMLVLCCCTFIKRVPWPCCNGEEAAPRGQRRTRVGSNGVPTVSAAVSDEQLYAQTGFHPRQRFAFTPPDYETVCKDLPRYEDLEAGGGSSSGSGGDSGSMELRGVSNAGFAGDSNQGEGDLPPPPPPVYEARSRSGVEEEGGERSGACRDAREEMRADSPPPPY